MISTCYAVRVAHGSSLKVTVGEGIGVVLSGAYHAAAALAADKGEVIAVWRFQDGTTHAEAVQLAQKVQPTKLLAVVSDEYGVLELAYHYLPEVEVITAPELP